LLIPTPEPPKRAETRPATEVSTPARRPAARWRPAGPASVGGAAPPPADDRADALSVLLARSVRQRRTGRTLARKHLPSADDFVRETIILNDRTLRSLASLLETWEKLNAEKRRGLTDLNDFERISTARRILVIVDQWLETHPAKERPTGPTTELAARREAAREAIKTLKDNAKLDADELSADISRWGKDAEQKLARHITARDMHKALDNLAPLLHMAAPLAGSKGEFEAEIEFALDPYFISFAGMRMKVEADRPDDTKIKARAELTLTCGGKIPDVGRIRLELGGYIEAQGRDGTEVMQLLSYAIYRKMRESRAAPREIANALWGRSWDTETGYPEAERWAGKVETEIMGAGDGYVESGLMLGAMAELGGQAGSAALTGKGQVTAGTGERWDKKSIRTIHQEKSEWSDEKIEGVAAFLAANPGIDKKTAFQRLAALGLHVSAKLLGRILGQIDKLPSAPLRRRSVQEDYVHEARVRAIVRAASPHRIRPDLGKPSPPSEYRFASQPARGERVRWAKVATEIKVGPAMMALKGELAYQSRGRDSVLGAHPRDLKVEGRVGLSIPLNKALSEELLALLHVAEILSGVAQFVRTSHLLVDDKKPSRQEKTARVYGGAANLGTGVDSALTRFEALGSKPFDWGGEFKSPIEPGLGLNVGLLVIVDAKFRFPQWDATTFSYEFNLHVAQEKGVKLNLDFGAVAGRVSGRTQERWLKLTLKDGVVTKDVFGAPAGRK
jgi:hypothetical protein